MEAPRTISSNAAPAGRRNKSEIAGTTRPELHVIKGNRTDESRVRRGFEQLLTWTRTRRTPLLHLVVAVAFLVVCLLGSLTLRTQMVQNSFEANQIETWKDKANHLVAVFGGTRLRKIFDERVAKHVFATVVVVKYTENIQKSGLSGA